MKKSYVYLGALLIAMTACKKEEVKVEMTDKDTTNVVTNDAPAEAAKPMDSLAMQKAWEEYATPGEMHKMLADEAGSWTAESKMWMDPSAPPQTSTMKAEIKMALGGRYQEGKYTGTMMGQPFEGKGTVAYNNASGEFEQTWMDNMGTGIMHMSGKYDPATKTVNYSGNCIDPMTKQPKKYRQTYKIVDDKTRVMEMFDNGPDGKEYKSMEITMHRK